MDGMVRPRQDISMDYSGLRYDKLLILLCVLVTRTVLCVSVVGVGFVGFSSMISRGFLEVYGYTLECGN